MTDETPTDDKGANQPPNTPDPPEGNQNSLERDIAAAAESLSGNLDAEWKELTDVPAQFRESVKAYTSRAVNDALESDRKKRKADEPKKPSSEKISDMISRQEVENLLATQRREFEQSIATSTALRDQATKLTRKVFDDMKIVVGSDAHQAFLNWYESEKAAGRITPQALGTEAGLRSAVLLSGVLAKASQGDPAGVGHGEELILRSADVEGDNEPAAGFGPLGEEDPRYKANRAHDEAVMKKMQIIEQRQRG
jgi:hypothetical protein